jgi:polyhydroxyalkanoate synthesis regulator phasin
MNSDSLIQLAQKSLRVTLGATAALVETMQDSQQREANLSKLKTELSQLAEEWEVKGESAEREARSFVDSLINQASSRVGQPTPPSTVSTIASPVPPADVQQDLQDLTEQIAALRTELEKLRAQDS